MAKGWGAASAVPQPGLLRIGNSTRGRLGPSDVGGAQVTRRRADDKAVIKRSHEARGDLTRICNEYNPSKTSYGQGALGPCKKSTELSRPPAMSVTARRLGRGCG